MYNNANLIEDNMGLCPSCYTKTKRDNYFFKMFFVLLLVGGLLVSVLFPVQTWAESAEKIGNEPELAENLNEEINADITDSDNKTSPDSGILDKTDLGIDADNDEPMIIPEEGILEVITADSLPIKENFNFWLGFVGSDVPKRLKEDKEIIIEVVAEKGEDYFFKKIEIARERGELNQDTENGYSYYDPYLAEVYSKDEGEEHLIGYHIRGLVPLSVYQEKDEYEIYLPEPVLEGEKLDINGSMFWWENEGSDLLEYGGLCFYPDYGGELGLKAGVTLKKTFVQVYQPKLEVVFNGGQPQDIEVDVTRIGTYESPDSIVGTLKIGINNTEKINNHDLYKLLLALDKDRWILDHFMIPSLNYKNLFKWHNKFTIEAPNLEGFVKEVTGDVETGWTIAYTAKVLLPEDENSSVPAGYVKVTFKSGDYGLFPQNSQTVFFVPHGASIGVEGLVIPTPHPVEGKEHSGWLATIDSEATSKQIMTYNLDSSEANGLLNYNISLNDYGEFTQHVVFTAMYEDIVKPTFADAVLEEVVLPSVETISTDKFPSLPAQTSQSPSETIDATRKLPATGESWVKTNVMSCSLLLGVALLLIRRSKG